MRLSTPTPRAVLLARHVFPTETHGHKSRPKPQKRSLKDLSLVGAFNPHPHDAQAQTHPDEPLAPRELLRLKKQENSEDPLQQKKLEQEVTRRIINQVFYEPDATLEDLTPHRIRVAHRLVREMARHRGYIRPDEMLIEALEPAYVPPAEDESTIEIDNEETEAEVSTTNSLVFDRWLYPEHYQKPPYDQKNPHMRLFLNVVQLMLDAEEINPSYLPFQWVAKTVKFEIEPDTFQEEQRWFPHHYPGVALLPPGIPYPFILADGTIRKDYDCQNPSHDPALHAYIKIIKALSEALYIDLGSLEDPDSGRYGLAGLFEPSTIRQAFPSRVQMMTWESLLVDETLDNIVRDGMPKANRLLQDRYGYQSIEAQQFLKMAKAKAAYLASGDSEEDRGVMILRLEDAARRARESLDIRAELAALKNLAIVQGLSRVDPQDAMSDFVSIVKNMSGRPSEMPRLPEA